MNTHTVILHFNQLYLFSAGAHAQAEIILRHYLVLLGTYVGTLYVTTAQV